MGSTCQPGFDWLMFGPVRLLKYTILVVTASVSRANLGVFFWPTS